MINEDLIEETNIKTRIFHKYNDKNFDNRKDPLTKITILKQYYKKLS